MKASFLAAFLLMLLSGCGTTQQSDRPPHNEMSAMRPPYVNIAVNLGLKHSEDLRSLYSALTSAGVRCGLRAMSLNAEHIVVESADSDRAKTIATAITIRDKLTVRLYKSIDSNKKPAASLLEVWEHGTKIREESYRVYLD